MFCVSAQFLRCEICCIGCFDIHYIYYLADSSNVTPEPIGI